MCDISHAIHAECGTAHTQDNRCDVIQAQTL